MLKLKTCPLCGGEALIKTEEYGGTARYVSEIFCVKGCVTLSDQYGDPADAIKRWNSRKIEISN